MNEKLLLFFSFCSFVLTYLMYRDYLNYLAKVTEKRVEISPRTTTTTVPPPPPVMYSENMTSVGGHNYTMVYDVPPKKNSTIYMLFWGHYIIESGWGHFEETIDREFLEKAGCPVTDCILTHKIDYLPNLYEYDAVMINAFNYNLTVPPVRSPHQLYIMSANE
jgi:hypothetical protein